MSIFGAQPSFDAPPLVSPTPMPSGPAPDTYRKPGLFGSGGVGRAIAGYIGDALLQRNGMQPVYGPAVEYRQRLAEQLRAQSLQSDQELQKEIGLYNYKLQHPDPGQLSDFDQQAIAGGYVPGTPEWAALHKQRVQELADPVVTTPTGMMLRSQALAQMAGTPAPAGVTFTPIDGGPTPPASGGFP